MANINYLIQKVKETYKEEGARSLAYKTGNYIKRKIKQDERKPHYKDILFIDGCTLPHPSRYRVDHQIEQLSANGLTADKIFYENLDLKLEKYYRGFIFFRCPITDEIKQFIEKAKSNNKTVFFDIDDLVFSKEYTRDIKHLKKLSKDELKLYYDGVKRMGETLKLCDYAITTTPTLSKELKKYVKEVYINRNVSSESMVKYSLSAMKNVSKKEDKVIIGYLSGSITHNEDFELILPVVKRVMEENKNVYLKICGLLDIPTELEHLKGRILASPFVSWEKLPTIISSIDINLAPLVDNLFNNAKSENKWTEAALCSVPTIASNCGAFKEVIKNKHDGILCKDIDSWYKELTNLIKNAEYRKAIGKNAQDKVLKNYVTTYTGYGLTKFIKSKLHRCVAFVLPTTNISGGVNVILKHCSILKNHGINSFIINCDKSEENIINNDGEIEVISNINTVVDAKIDMMVASLWATLDYVNKYDRVIEKAYLVQNFETDFMKYGDYGRIIANSTYSYDNIKYITISKWCSDWLKEKYERDSIYIPNGIDIELFPQRKRAFDKKIKILIEGNSDDYYKNVDESFKIVEKLDKEKFEIIYLSYQGKPKEWYYVDKFLHRVPHDQIGKVYAEHDILIKSSILESFSYPPLEMMATGGLNIVVPNEGNVEYLENEKNCLFYERGNIDDAVSKINKLIEDSDLRKKLIEKGIETACSRDWKSIEEQIYRTYSGE